MTTFYKDLKKYNIEDLIKIYREQKKDNIKKIYEKIIFEKKQEDMIKISYSLAKRFNIAPTEMLEESYIVFWKCLKSFPIDRDGAINSFSRYFTVSLYKQLKVVAKKENEYKNMFILEDSLVDLDGGMEDFTKVTDLKILEENIFNNIELEEMEKNVLLNIYGFFNYKILTINEFCEEYNITRNQFNYLNKMLLDKIRKVLD